METGIQAMTDNVQEVVPERQSQETDEKNVLESVFGEGGTAKKRRVMYRKEFLVECFSHPACSRCPSFPDSVLDCTLTTARLKDLSKAIFDPSKHKEVNGRKDNEDNISLRPQSGNFSSGCAPNLSPAFAQNQYNRFPFQHEDQAKNTFDRGFNRYRFNSSNPRQDLNRQDMNRQDINRQDMNRQDMNDSRNRMDRDRDMPPRERDKGEWDRDRERDRDMRNRSQNYNRRQNPVLFGPESDSQNDWTRRRTAGPYDNSSGRMRMNHGGRDRYGHRDREEDEPEWFSGGPKSQHETIELHGFQDDERRDFLRSREKSRAADNDVPKEPERNGAVSEPNRKEEERRSEESKSVDLSLEKILQMEHISGILPNGLFEEVEPTGSSRFSQFFQRNSSANHNEDMQNKVQVKNENASADGNMLQNLFAPRVEQQSEGDSKSDIRKTMECELRRVLLRSGEKDQAPEQPKEPPKQEDVNAIQKLFSELMSKSNKTAENKVQGAERGINRGVAGPPPGLQGMFNSFAFNNAPQAQPQPRPQHQPQQSRPNPGVQLPANPVMLPASNPLSRLIEQQHLQEIAAQNQKRSSTPISALNAFTPTSVMRKMTGDQQTKVATQGPIVTSYSGMPQVNNGSGSAFTSNYNATHHANNPLASFMSAMSAQSQQPHHHHIPPPQPQMPPIQAAGHHMHPIPAHVHAPPHPGGYHPPPPPQRMHYPVMVGPPNSGMRAQFPPFVMYGPQMPQRK